MRDEQPKPVEDASASLVNAIRSESLGEVLSTVADTGLDALVTSGAFDGIPLFGILTGVYRAQNEIRGALYLRNVMRFLEGLGSTSQADRDAFTRRLDSEGRTREFGETVLLILNQVDAVQKPGIMGRIMKAHIRGEMNYADAMRLLAIVNRSYAPDLQYLRSFQPGIQPDEDVATSLFAVGVLRDVGSDGGTFDDPNSGGTLFAINRYGELVVKFGLEETE